MMMMKFVHNIVVMIVYCRRCVSLYSSRYLVTVRNVKKKNLYNNAHTSMNDECRWQTENSNAK